MRREERLELERSPLGFAAATLTLTNGTESNPTTGGGSDADSQRQPGSEGGPEEAT